MIRFATCLFTIVAVLRGGASAQTTLRTGSDGEPRSMSQEGPNGSHAPADPQDISGVWTLRYRQQIAGGGARIPGANPGPAPDANFIANQCVPEGGYGTTPGYPVFILQTKHYTAFVSEENHKTHMIYMGLNLRPDLPPAYVGYSTGNWVGDQLVVQLSGLRNQPEGYHEIDVFRKTHDGTRLEDLTTIEVPGKPIQKILTAYNWRPELHLQENLCEDFIEPFGVGYYKDNKGG